MLSFCRREEGQDIVEYALVLPLLMLVMLGIMEFGILFWNYNTIANAAREGARAGIVPGVTVEQVETAARRLTIGLNPDPAFLTIDPSFPTPTTVRVIVEYRTSLITGPMIRAVTGDGTITLRARATMNRE